MFNWQGFVPNLLATVTGVFVALYAERRLERRRNHALERKRAAKHLEIRRLLVDEVREIVFAARAAFNTDLSVSSSAAAAVRLRALGDSLIATKWPLLREEFGSVCQDPDERVRFSGFHRQLERLRSVSEAADLDQPDAARFEGPLLEARTDLLMLMFEGAEIAFNLGDAGQKLGMAEIGNEVRNLKVRHPLSG